MATLHEVSGLITSALNLIKIKQESTAVTLPTTDYQPPNKNIAVQRPFYSTKRKRKHANVRLSKPNLTEKEDMVKILLHRSKKKPLLSNVMCIVSNS